MKTNRQKQNKTEQRRTNQTNATQRILVAFLQHFSNEQLQQEFKAIKSKRNVEHFLFAFYIRKLIGTVKPLFMFTKQR